MASAFNSTIESEILKINPNVVFNNWSKDRKLIVYNALLISKYLCYENKNIFDAQPHLLRSGLNCDDFVLSSLTTDERSELIGNYLCKFCGHVPIDTVACNKFEAMYCKRCVVYLQRLAMTRSGKELPTVFDPENVINCLFINQYHPKHLGQVREVQNPVIMKLMVKCNLSDCPAALPYTKMIDHLNQTHSSNNWTVNATLLSAFFNTEVSSHHIHRLAQSYIEQFAGVPFNACDSEKPAECIEGHRFSSDRIPTRGVIGRASEDDQQPSTSHPYRDNSAAFLKRLTSFAKGYLPEEAIAGTVPVHCPLSKQTVYSLMPDQSGVMEIDLDKVSVVRAAQIIGERKDPENTEEDWVEKIRRAQLIPDEIKRRNVINNIKYRWRKKEHKNKANIKRKTHLYLNQLAKFQPPLTVDKSIHNFHWLMRAIERLSKATEVVVALDCKGQTLKIENLLYGVPGSVGIVGMRNSIVLHDILRWPQKLLANPNPNWLTRLSWEACQHGPTLGIVRSRVAEVLWSAKKIILHGQSSDLKSLFFTPRDYECIRHKIRDVGAYYSITHDNKPMSLQLATYLLFQTAIQGRNYHYAVQDTFWTLMLYYADMDAIEDVYENAKNNLRDNEGYLEVVYPPNHQMSALYREYQASHDDWPDAIKFRKCLKPRLLHKEEDDHDLVDATPYNERRQPYTVPMHAYQQFYVGF